jgi:hypothetical protein
MPRRSPYTILLSDEDHELHPILDNVNTHKLKHDRWLAELAALAG